MKNNKMFLITIDTEGDNQWDNEKGIATENARFLPRFQELAEKYGFKPTWLVNYEMANDEFFVKYMKNKQNEELCEIGMHLHAWNNPPEYKLNKVNNERDYLIEYPEDIMRKKIKVLTELITNKFEKKPVSHRSGRWTTNKTYLKILDEFGYKVDCSITPHINWKNNVGSTGFEGSDYSNCSEKPYYIYNNILEVPMTIKKSHHIEIERIRKPKNFLGEFKRFVFGRNQWMRPDKHLSKRGLKNLIKLCNKNNEYIMFMIHSSELMPGGSPSFKTNESIEKLYEVIEDIFIYAKDNGYVGITLKEYYMKYIGECKNENCKI